MYRQSCRPWEEARRKNIQIFLSSDSLILCWCCPLGKHNQKPEDRGAWTAQAIEATLQDTEQAEEKAAGVNLEEGCSLQFLSRELEYHAFLFRFNHLKYELGKSSWDLCSS